MKEWAKKDIELFLTNNKEDDFYGYMSACCDSAYKAYLSLLNDGHSGMSINITKGLLNKLINGEPLTPIEDKYEVWDNNFRASKEYDYISKQCLRMSSLFKYIYKDGRVVYTDLNRVICCDVNNPELTYSSGLVRDIIDEKFPITMPYTPNGKFTVYCEDFLLNEDSGDFDTVGILYAILPNGERYEINHFIHYPKNGDGPVEIPKNVYDEYKRFVEKRDNRK